MSLAAELQKEVMYDILNTSDIQQDRARFYSRPPPIRLGKQTYKAR